MKRAIIIGCPGSGKSTFAVKLHNLTGIPLFHLDMMYWNEDKTIVPKHIFSDRLNNALKEDLWIIDGNYGGTMELRLKACDTVFFLDYPLNVCLDGVRERMGRARSDMPWVEDPHKQDEEFLELIKNYSTKNRPAVIQLLKDYSDKTIFIFNDRRDADEFIERISHKSIGSENNELNIL